MEHKQRSDMFWKVLSVTLLVALAGLAAVVLWQGQNPRYIYYERGNQAKSELAALAPNANVNHDSIYWIADLAEKSLPFVVNIETKFEAPQQSAQDPKQQKDAQDFMNQWQEMLPEPFKNMPAPENGQQQYQLPEDHPPVGGTGSGFIIREDGYIVTNAHVVESADSFTVRFSDGTEKDAKLIGADRYKDIAVLKVEGEKLPVAVLGDSEAARVGEPVVAIGSPLGYQQSVTSGIISMNKRTLADLGRQNDVRRPQEYIQTDAAINQGNSGGPLLNANGEVIGVNQAIVRWESNGAMFGNPVPVEGIGFAIPINAVKSSIEQIVQHGKVIYPGIQAAVISVEDFLKLEPNVKLEVNKGVFVRTVTTGGPADRAGIKAGDVILTLNGVEMQSGQGLIEEIQRHNVGERLTLRVARQGGKTQEDVTVVLGELDTSEVQIE
jgi:S1-C subfamily serine protease